jgi:hypothetical protein
MKFNKWTLGLAAVGVVSLASAARADEKVSQLNTALSNTTLSGYVDVGAQYVNATGAAYSLNTAGNGFSLNTVDLALDKPLDATPFSAGYHVELWTGGAPVGTGSLVRQAYLALGTTIAGQEIDWKIGVWDTLIGYEGLTSGNNPNYTHSYGFFVEPTDHTGVQATYKVNDEITVQAGIADEEAGNAATINGVPTAGEAYALSSPELLALVSFTAPDSWGTLKGATLSVGGTDNTSDAGPKNVYVGATVPTPLAALKLGAAYDYLDAGSGAGHVNVFGVYGTYTATDKLTFNLRGELAEQTPDGPAPAPFIGTLASKYGEEFTATASYALWANVTSRVEARWDHAETGSYGPGATAENAIFLGAQLIYTF